MANCTGQPDLGRILAVGVFAADECLAPIYGPRMGYYDDCATISTSDNTDDGEDFTRRCPDGSIRRFVPGKRSLQSIEVNIDYHWFDPSWMGEIGGAQPITQGGEVIGWSDCTQDRFNLIVVVWQEILGAGACADGTLQAYVRIYPLKDARITEEGDVGAEDSYTRITGMTVDTHALGSGPLPLAAGETRPEWLTQCLADGCHRFRFIGAPPPDLDECGPMDTEEPTVACVPAGTP